MSIQKIKLKITGIHCAACVKTIEGDLSKEPGVESAKVNQESGKAVIIYNDDDTSPSKIKSIIAQAGDYKAHDLDEDEVEENNREGNSNYLTIMLSLIGLGILVIIVLLISQSSSSKMRLADNSKNTFKDSQELPSDRKPSNNAAPAPSGAAIDFVIDDTDHVRGNINAPVTIVEYSDFQCPFCARFHNTMNQIMAEYPEDVRWVYRHFPIDSIHPLARELAEASECAADQGKFWEYNDEVYANQQGISGSSAVSFASNIGLDMDKFNNCLDSGKYSEEVKADQSEGQSYGVTGTPGSFINGQALGGAAPYAQLKQMIDGILE